MKYFRAVNIDDVTDVLYVSGNCDTDTLEKVAERLKMAEYGYKLVECSKEEFETMTQEEYDYIINVGQTRDDLGPFVAAPTEYDAINKAKELSKDYKYVEVVYMPIDNEDINEIVWKKYN